MLRNIADNQFNDEDNDDIFDADGDVDRPKFTLAGPYKYEVTLKNSNAIKTIKLNAMISERAEENTDIDLSVSSVDENNTKRQMDMSYKRNSSFIFF